MLAGVGSGGRFLLLSACFVVLVAGLKTSGPVLIPFLLSAFIAILCNQPLQKMTQRGVPTLVAILLLITLVVFVAFTLALFLGSSVAEFKQALPGYQDNLTAQMADLIVWLQGMGLGFSPDLLQEYINPAFALQMVANLLGSLGGLLTSTFLIVLTVAFMLMEAVDLPARVQRALGDPKLLEHFRLFNRHVNQYIAIKTGVSALTGCLISGWLWFLGIDFPLMWGMLAFLLNYIPNIGSIIAAVPAALLGLVQFGVDVAGLAVMGYLVVNTVMGNVIEPRFMGKGLDLSPLVVFMSLIFWGWTLGSAGMFLSVPLTMVVKIGLESSDDTRWLGVLLGSGDGKHAEEPA